MYGTKSEILLDKILKNVGLINTAPYLYTSEVNPYSTKTERILYLIELNTRGLGPLIDDLRLNREYYFDFQTTDYVIFTVPYICTLKDIVKSNATADITIVKLNGTPVGIEEEVDQYTQLKITSTEITHLTLKFRLNDYI